MRVSARKSLAASFGFALAAIAGGCLERADRWLDEPPPPACTVGLERCTANFERCVDGPGGPHFEIIENCQARELVCAFSLKTCTPCVPNGTS